MKRYLYILFIAALAFVACEPNSNEAEPKVSASFGQISVEAKDKSAIVIVNDTYLTVDGERYNGAKVWIEFTSENIDTTNSVEEYNIEGDYITFTLDNLTPETKYEVYVVIDGGKYGKHTSDKTSFTTSEETQPIVELTYEAEVDAKGLMAMVEIKDVAYLVDGQEKDIFVVEIEYARQGTDEWTSVEFVSDIIMHNTISMLIPFEGKEYLEENRNYVVRFTLYPKDDDYEPLTSDAIMFKTTYAEVTANIATPTLTLEQSSIKASTENIEVFYDGVSAEEYKHGYPIEYYFDYRVKGSNDWTRIETAATNGYINATLPAQEGNNYEVKAVVVAGAMKKVRESAIAEITVPKKETPTSQAHGILASGVAQSHRSRSISTLQRTAL